MNTKSWGLIVLLLTIIGTFFYLVHDIVLPFVLGGVLAYIASPIGHVLRKNGAPAWVQNIGVLLPTLLFLGLVLFVLMPFLQEETMLLSKQLPLYVQALYQKLLLWLGSSSSNFEAAIHEKVFASSSRVLEWVSTSTLELLSHSMVLLNALLVLFLAPFFAFYFYKDRANIRTALLSWAPTSWRTSLLSLARELDHVLSGFLRGQIIVCLTMAIYYTVLLTLSGIPYSFSIGIFTGLFLFVPYIGFFSGLTLALLIALTQSTSLHPLLSITCVYGMGWALEALVLTPRLIGQRIGVHPVWIIFSIFAFGSMFGFWGILAAIPMAGVFKVLLGQLKPEWLQKSER